jgi:actin-related protein
MVDFDNAEAMHNAVPVKNLTECSFYERKNGMECKDFEPSIIQDDKILKVAKRLKTFTLEDIVMFCDINTDTAEKFLHGLENIKPVGNKFEYLETIKVEDKFKIIDKNIPNKNSDITVITACEIFLENCQNRDIKINTIKAYKTFINAHIIPYFKNFKLKDVMVSDIEQFRKIVQTKKISERRIKNILTLLNQIIKYFQNEGYIAKTCIFEVKRVANIPKRQIQILSPEQLVQLFKITNKKYPYLTQIIQKMITLKQPLNTILIGSEQQRKSLKRKIRKDFYKIKQELGLTNYVFDDLLSIDN